LSGKVNFLYTSWMVEMSRELPYNEREESVVKQHNLFGKMLYSNNETKCFGL